MTPLIAAALLLQAGSAEETFDKIGEAIRKAKAARVVYSWEGASKADASLRVEASGSALFKEGNRLSLCATIVERGQSNELKVVSDGSTVKTRLGPKRILECAVPGNFEAGLKTALHRLGAMQAVLIAHKVCMLDPSEQEEALEMGRKPPLSDLRLGPDDGESKTLTYKITPDGPDSAAEVKLWYAADSYRLLKRTITLKQPTESVFTEVYKEWTLDGELDNEEFTLPSLK